MPTAVRRSRPLVAALIAAAALVAGSSYPGGAKAAESAAATGPVVSDFSFGTAQGGTRLKADSNEVAVEGVTQSGFIMGDGQTPCDPIRHSGAGARAARLSARPPAAPSCCATAA